jgi:cytoskeleton protein RodZ
MGAFGERLRREREMRGISLNEISESTKISRRHLEALESEDFDALPGGVFNRGFVRAYARFVGIDEEQAVADYNAVRHEQPPPPDQFPLEVHNKPDRELNPRRSPIPLILAIAALLGFIGAVWLRSRSHQQEAGKSVAAPVSAHTPGPSSASPSPSPVPGNGAAAAPMPDKAPAKPVPVSSVPPNKTPALPLPTPTPTPDRRFVVVVRAKEDAWVSLSADGLTAWEGFLKANKQRLVRAGKQIVLTTNNAGGLTISHNGKVLRALGNENEVRTLTFTRAGLVQ